MQAKPAPATRRRLCTEIERPRVLDALALPSIAPVRLLCAPHGGGKTTALLQYAAQHRDAHFISLPQHASRSQVAACLAKAADARLIVVDRADTASPSGQEALFESIEDHWPRGTCYLLSGSSRTRMRAVSLVARGVAELIDASVLPFTGREIQRLASAQGVASDEVDIQQLKYDTDGWPIAVSWIIRDAARNGRGLRGALEQWSELNGHLLLEFVTTAHGDTESSEAFVAAVRSFAGPASQRTFERLDADGYPIVRMRSGLRPYRLLARIAGDEPANEPAGTGDRHLVLKLFGNFSCTIANQPVAFDRRRDQNLLTYVALAPGATVARAELLAKFWPNALPAVASQGLRTTLFRLRRAVSDAAGCDAGRYVSVGNAISLDLDWVSIDARAFRDYVALAQAEDANGNRSAARGHYLEAERLHIGTLLASEAIEPQLEARAAEFDGLFKFVLSHLVETHSRARTSRPVRDDLQPRRRSG
jgi:DNA-binding SARP family transcriptional activator